MKTKILIVEDDKDIQDVLYNYLESAGYHTILANDGEEGLSKFDDSIHLVILDIMLPKIDGFEVCEKIRKCSNVPVVMLTALGDEANALKGYKQQADDYISKPFSPKILLHKIERILQRYTPISKNDSNSINYQELCMDMDGYHVYYRQEELCLTQKEFAILRVLLSNQGIVFTRQMIIDLIWHENDFIEDRVVDSHIKNLRKKLQGKYIRTIRGVGYRIDK